MISEEMSSMIISEADTILVMDEKSLNDYENKVKAGGTLIINQSMITKDAQRKYLLQKLLQKLLQQKVQTWLHWVQLSKH